MPSPVSYLLQHKHQSVLTTLFLKELKVRLAVKNCPVIADKKVQSLYPDLFAANSEKLLLLPAGERHKTNSAVSRIHSFLLQCKTTRNTEVFVLGGGTITDTAAYAVSTFKRGCSLTLVPTTLLGMVDAAVGGKTAINSNGTKNLLGTFYPANKIIITPEFLSTLPQHKLLNGLAEMVKLWHIVPRLDLPRPSAINNLSGDEIAAFAQAKLEICALDPLDRKERRLLNLGHTFGHVLEAMTGFRITHGKAVALGIVLAARFSHRSGYISHATAKDIEDSISALGFETRLDANSRKQFMTYSKSHLKNDKKADEAGLVLVLFKAYRQVFVSDTLPLPSVLQILPHCL